LETFPKTMKEMAMAIAPVALIFFIFQVTLLKMSKASVAKIVVALFYTYVGLVLFLTGRQRRILGAGISFGK